MVDFAIDVFKKLHPNEETPQHFFEKRGKVVTELKELEKLTETVLAIITKDEVTQEVSKTRDPRQLFESLQQNHGVCGIFCFS
jgi:hypothetical protein